MSNLVKKNSDLVEGLKNDKSEDLSTKDLIADVTNEKGLTVKQEAFLEAFFGPAAFDVVRAKEMAGYSKTSNTRDIIRPLRDVIQEALKDELTVGAARSVSALMGVLDDPTKPGNKEKIAAANSLLDRYGLTKEAASRTNIKVEVAPVVYLPQKKELDLTDDDYIDITGD